MTIELLKIKPGFDALVSQLQTRLASEDSWKDQITTSTGQTLIEFFAAIGAFDQYSIESALQEMFLDTAKLDSSIYAISRMLGVRLTRKVPPSTSVTLTRIDTTLPLSIPSYSSFSSSTTKLFNRNSIVFSAGQSVANTTLYSGVVESIDYRGLGVDFQSIVTSESDFSISDIDVVVKINDIQIPVVTDGLWFYKNSTPAVQDMTTARGELHLLFGNTNYGTVPDGGSVISIVYATTLGLDGNDLTFSGNQITYDNDSTVTGVSTTALSGGANEQSAEVYRKISPLVFAASNRAVTPSDHIGLALTYAGVYDAKLMGQRDLSPTDPAYMNLVRVTLLTNPVWSTQNFNDFITWFTKKSMFSTRFYRQDPLQRLINITAEITCNNLADLNEVKASVEAALTAFFTPRIGIISLDVYKSDIYDVIKASHEHIDYIKLLSPTEDIISELVAPTLSLSATAGTLAAGTYSYRISALNAIGETFASTNQVITLVSTGGVLLNWVKPYGATGYKIYGRTNGAELLLTTVGDVTAYTDSGSLTPSGAPPSIDTTGIHYPALGTTALTLDYTYRT